MIFNHSLTSPASDQLGNTGERNRRNGKILVLSRHRDESIVIGHDITITVVDIRGDKVRIAIDAPREVSVHRREVYDAIQRERDDNSLDTLVPTACCECGGSGKLDYGSGETSCPICNSLDTKEPKE